MRANTTIRRRDTSPPLSCTRRPRLVLTTYVPRAIWGPRTATQQTLLLFLMTIVSIKSSNQMIHLSQSQVFCKATRDTLADQTRRRTSASTTTLIWMWRDRIDWFSDSAFLNAYKTDSLHGALCTPFADQVLRRRAKSRLALKLLTSEESGRRGVATREMKVGMMNMLRQRALGLQSLRTECRVVSPFLLTEHVSAHQFCHLTDSDGWYSMFATNFLTKYHSLFILCSFILSAVVEPV